MSNSIGSMAAKSERQKFAKMSSLCSGTWSSPVIVLSFTISTKVVMNFSKPFLFTNSKKGWISALRLRVGIFGSGSPTTKRVCLKRSGKIACLHRFETRDEAFKSVVSASVSSNMGSSCRIAEGWVMSRKPNICERSSFGRSSMFAGCDGFFEVMGGSWMFAVFAVSSTATEGVSRSNEFVPATMVGWSLKVLDAILSAPVAVSTATVSLTRFSAMLTLCQVVVDMS